MAQLSTLLPFFLPFLHHVASVSVVFPSIPSHPIPSHHQAGGRALREVELTEPIRYGAGDGVERWLIDLLCLDCLGDTHRILRGASPAQLT